MSLLGQTLGSYQIFDEAGHGRMGTVYRAYQPSLSRYVAIKVLAADLASNDEFMERLCERLGAVARLRHSNIIAVYDIQRETDRSYIVTDYYSDPTLAEILDRDGPLSLARATHIVEQLASALDAAHQQGILHGDVTPANIFVGKNDHVVLSDFSLAIAAAEAGVGEAGTPEYMSPEQAQGQEIGRQSDLYSLGAVAYQMLTGRRPFSAETGEEPGQQARQQAGGLPPARLLQPGLPRSIEPWLSKALAGAPGERWMSGGAMAGALRQLLLGEEDRRRVQPLSLQAEPIHKEGPPALPVVTPPPAWRRVPIYGWAAIGVAIVLTLALSGMLIARGGAHRGESSPSPSASPMAVVTLTRTLVPTRTPTPPPTLPPIVIVPTSTPMPAATATRTPLPTATWTPMPTATSTPVPTATRRPPTPVPPSPTPSPKPVARPALVSPEDGKWLANQITFQWAWNGTLAADEYFDVYVRKHTGSEAQYTGLCNPVKQRSVQVNLSNLVEDPDWNNWDDGPIRTETPLLWSVAVIRWNGQPGSPHYILKESELRLLVYAGSPPPTRLVIPGCECNDYTCGHCGCHDACCQKCCRKCQGGAQNLPPGDGLAGLAATSGNAWSASSLP